MMYMYIEYYVDYVILCIHIFLSISYFILCALKNIFIAFITFDKNKIILFIFYIFILNKSIITIEWIIMKHFNWNRIPVIYVPSYSLSLYLERSIWKKFWFMGQDYWCGKYGTWSFQPSFRHIENGSLILHPDVSSRRKSNAFMKHSRIITSRVLLYLAKVAMSTEKRERRDSMINISNLKAAVIDPALQFSF